MFGGNFGNNQQGHGHHGHHHGHKTHHKHNENHGFNNQFNPQLTWAPNQGCHYRIVSGLSSDMVLDVSQNHHHHNQLILYNWNNGDNQKFYFQSCGGNKYGIFSVKSNQTVQIHQGGQHNGTKVVCSQPNKQVNQFWQLVPANFHNKPNAFYLKSFCGKTMDVAENKCENEAKILQWDYNGGNNQIWVIEQV